MKKIIFLTAAAGMVASISTSAFAADRLPADNISKSAIASETYISDLGDGVSVDDVMKDFISAAGISYTDEGAQTELGAGASIEDTAKDMQ